MQFLGEHWQERDQNGTYLEELHSASRTLVMQIISEPGAGMTCVQSIHASEYAAQPLPRVDSEEQLRSTNLKTVNGTWRTYFGVVDPISGLDTLN